jgi:hypothetical protein
VSAEVNASWSPKGRDTAFVPQELRGLAASSQVGRGQFATISPSTGFASLNDGTRPNEIPAGVAYPAVVSGVSSIGGAAQTAFWVGYGGGMPASTETNDGFLVTDIAVPFYIAGESTPGKLSSFDGDSRSIGGLVMGLDERGDPILICGPIAWLLARMAAAANAMDFAWFQRDESAASDTLAEFTIPSQKLHGLITAVQFTGAAIAADNTDYITVTIAKRVLADAYAAATTIATYDSRAANNGAVSAFTPANFTLSVVAGALNALETDVYTIVVAKGGAGKVIDGSFRVIGKVQ